MNRPWFDKDTGLLLFDEYVAEMPSYRKIMADEVITDEELKEQAVRVASLFQSLERRLAPEFRSSVTDALCELAVLHSLAWKKMGQRDN